MEDLVRFCKKKLAGFPTGEIQLLLINSQENHKSHKSEPTCQFWGCMKERLISAGVNF